MLKNIISAIDVDNQKQLLKLLKTKGGQNLMKKHKFPLDIQFAPLHYAAWKGKTECLKIMIEKGGTIVSLKREQQGVGS